MQNVGSGAVMIMAVVVGVQKVVMREREVGAEAAAAWGVVPVQAGHTETRTSRTRAMLVT
jgi:hypothetical protein